MLFAILKTKKLPANCNLRKIHKQFRKTQPLANSTQADSEAILPNRTQLVFLRAILLRENGLSRPAKGGFHPCFCLPACCNCPVALSEFVTCFIRAANSELGSFKNCNCSRGNRLQNDLLRKCGLLAHTSPAFLKNCWIKKLLVACGLWLEIMALRENGLSRQAKGGSTPAFACQRAAIAPLPCSNLQLVS